MNKYLIDKLWSIVCKLGDLKNSSEEYRSQIEEIEKSVQELIILIEKEDRGYHG